MFNIKIIGYLAGIFITITMVPQIYTSIKIKSVENVSVLMLTFFFLSMFLWFIYGILQNDLPLMIFNGLATIIAGIQLGIKIYYKK